MQKSGKKKTQKFNPTTVKYLFIECLLGEALAQQCFCAEQDTRPETGRPGQQQLLKTCAVAAHQNFLRRISLNQDFVQPPKCFEYHKMTSQKVKCNRQIQRFAFLTYCAEIVYCIIAQPQCLLRFCLWHHCYSHRNNHMHSIFQLQYLQALASLLCSQN